MTELQDFNTDALLNQFSGMLGWELVAVILALAYLILALRRSQWCWPAAFISTLIYTLLFWHVSLLMESLLNVYYMGMAVFGFYCWHRHSNQGEAVSVITWQVQYHLIAIVLLTLLSVGVGFLMDSYTDADMAYLDAATTCFAVFTTYLVATRVLENWLYWIVIDLVSIYLYFEKELYLTALLFIVYVVLAVLGYATWKRAVAEQSNADDGIAVGA